jgi:hypothetical protein
MSQLEYLFKQYETILGWYRQAESKGTLLHAINGALVAALNGLVFVGAEKFKNLHVTYAQGIKTLLILTSVCVVASYLFMLKAVWARHHLREPPLSDKEKLWFFGHVAAMPRETYRRLLDPFVEADVIATMLAQNHILSRNVATKFDALNRAISLTIAAIVLFFILGMVYASAAVGGQQG